MCRLKNDNIPKIFTELNKNQNISTPHLKIIPSNQYEILYFVPRASVMEYIFAKQRKGNGILLTHSLKKL